MDALSEHACEAAATGRAPSNVGMAPRRPPPSDGRLQLDQLHDELRRGVQFTQHPAHQDDDADGDADTGEAHPMRSPRSAASDDDARAMDRFRDEQRARCSPVFAHDEAENEEITAFLGLTISTIDKQEEITLYHQLRAASFTAGTRPRIVPCSPPVPIPQKHRLRRNSAAIAPAGRTSSGSMLIPTHDHQYSRTQCEARLWDEYWNYKLSLESRESFEASSSNNQRDGRENPLPGKTTPTASTNQDQKSKHRTISEASTEDTARDSSEELAGDGIEADVFDMDDL